MVLITLILILLDELTELNNGRLASILRAFKILRIFSYFKYTKNIKLLFNTFIITLPAMSSIGGLLALLIYVYAILGVTLFAEVREMTPLDQVQNFQSFGCTFLILIKIATGDGWAELMNIMSR